MDYAEAENGGQQKPSIESQINARKLCQFWAADAILRSIKFLDG